MKKPQWITIGAAIFLTAIIFLFGRTVPKKTFVKSTGVSTDSILQIAKRQLNKEQATKLALLENSISRGNVKDQQISVYHQLAHFWGDSVGFFPPYAIYEAEAARLENSEKSLTFAAHLFLSDLQEQHDEDAQIIEWKTLQARDLFERSLKINPNNDSSIVGMGATYLFSSSGQPPMKGIQMIRNVLEKDSTNLYAQMMMVQGSLKSGQIDKAITRLQTVNRMYPDNISAILLLADVYERTNDKAMAIVWYKKSLSLIERADYKAMIEQRINDLTK